MASNVKEPTRPIGQPTPASDGTLRAKTTLSPKACRVRARIEVPPSKVLPIIVVPGIMGSNLRATTSPGAPSNLILKPGESAWRPPNGINDGITEASTWEKRDPATRQKILNGATLEVDPTGPINLRGHATMGEISQESARSHGWGEIHWSSYGSLLIALKLHFSKFMDCGWNNLPPSINSAWSSLNRYDRTLWKKSASEALVQFTSSEVERLAQYWYPVYAFGYNWLQSNESSANNLRKRIEKIILHYKDAGLECEKVVIVTHSMGGLVARACAKQIPQRIAGIVHACMPALGAPVCYRRIACGTETSSPSNGAISNAAAEKFADIAGRSSADTNAVMAHAPGALELLPTHRYPGPWLFALQNSLQTGERPVILPFEDPYDLYRDTTSWYRLFQPELIDPAKLHGNLAIDNLLKSIGHAQKFHATILGDYYHQNSFAIYGADTAQLSYGSYIWKCATVVSGTPSVILTGKHLSSTVLGHRSVEISDGRILSFYPSVQDEAGDGTVPKRSGADVAGKVKEAFVLPGFDHQGVFSDLSIRLLTIQLVARALLI